MSNWKQDQDLQVRATRYGATVTREGNNRSLAFLDREACDSFLEAILGHPNSPYRDLPYSLDDNTFGYQVCLRCHSPLPCVSCKEAL